MFQGAYGGGNYEDVAINIACESWMAASTVRDEQTYSEFQQTKVSRTTVLQPFVHSACRSRSREGDHCAVSRGVLLGYFQKEPFLSSMYFPPPSHRLFFLLSYHVRPYSGEDDG